MNCLNNKCQKKTGSKKNARKEDCQSDITSRCCATTTVKKALKMDADSEVSQTLSPPESIVMEKARIAMQLKLEGNGELFICAYVCYKQSNFFSFC